MRLPLIHKQSASAKTATGQAGDIMSNKIDRESIEGMTLVSRKPTHPGEMIREEFMPDYNLSVSKLGELLGVSRQSANELVRERRAVSPEMALRLARVFKTSPQYWMNMQRNVDLWDSLELNKDAIMNLHPVACAG